MQKRIIITQDGSPSIHIEELNETYHSKHGAITESNYVYIKKGLIHWLNQNNKNKIKVFEMGFGTGLNAYLTYLYTFKKKITCDYFTIEKYPLSLKEVRSLKFKESLPSPTHHHFFDMLHRSDWNKELYQSNFFFKKVAEDFFNMDLDLSFDVLFYDAFSYKAQSEMWHEKALKKCYDILESDGIWVSYCAKGSVRRILEKLGFLAERLEGPPGKREILRATKHL